MMIHSLHRTREIFDVGFDAGSVWRSSAAKRGAFLHRRLVAVGGRGVAVRRLGGCRAGEIRLTRFLRNPAVTFQEMALTAAARTGARCRGARHVLAIQDTTVVRSEGGGGHYLHAMICVEAGDGALLGLADGQFLSRGGGKKGKRRSLPIEHKESMRWLDGAQAAVDVCAGAERVTVIADREGDIYEAFARCPAGTELLIRAAHDRALADGGRLFACIDALPEAGRTQILLPARPGKGPETAIFSVRFSKAALKKPANGARSPRDPDAVGVYAADLRQINAAAGADPVHWRLLATQPVTNLAQALEVAGLYRRRWLIEQVFRTLKTKGFDIEALRIEDEAPREKLVMATLIAAVSVQQLVHARDGLGDSAAPRPLTDVFDAADRSLIEAFSASLEGKTARQKNPHPKHSLAYATWVCARLGGWTGYYGKPGPITILRGYLDLKAASRGANIMKGLHDV